MIVRLVTDVTALMIGFGATVASAGIDNMKCKHEHGHHHCHK